MTDLHVWEKCGLGKAPFKYVGFYENRFQVPGCPSKPGGTCDYCSNGILICCQIESSDGKRFVVGSDCVRKVGEEGITKALKSSAEYRTYQRDMRHEREAKKIATLTTQWEALHSKIAERPHPNKYHADQGKTFLDYQKWGLAQCGTSGTIRHLKAILARDWS